MPLINPKQIDFSIPISSSVDISGSLEVTGSSSVTGSFQINGNPPIVSGSFSGSTLRLNKSDNTEFQTNIPPGLGNTGLGWARYDDGVYTTSSFFVVENNGEVRFPNSGSFVIDDHIHSNIQFYDTGSQRVQAEFENDVYVHTIVFRAKTTNANTGYFRIQLDNIGDTPYSRVGKDFFFPKGNNVWHDFHEVFQYYADEDFINNGCQWNIQSFNAEIDIADVIYFIQRTQNHGGE